MKKKLKDLLRWLTGYRYHGRFSGISEIKYNYSAFISYYQIPDKSFADALQRSLRILGSKWYLLKFRALEVFRDETDTSGFVSLKKKIVSGIDQSEFLLLLASKTGKELCVSQGRKDWVADEIDYWLNSRHARELATGEKIEQLKIIICVTDGNIKWDGVNNDFDWKETNCLPINLKNKFSETPLWVDLRDIKNADSSQQSNLSLEFPSFKQKVAEISALIQNVSVDELISKDKQYKSIGRIVIAALIALFSILTALSALFAYNSGVNEKKAIQVTIKNQNTLGISALILSRNAETIGSGVSGATEASADINTDPSLYIGVQQGLTASISRTLNQFSLSGAGTAVGFDFYKNGEIICDGNDGLISIWDIGQRKLRTSFGEEQMRGVGSFQRFTGGQASSDKRYFVGSLMAPAIQVWDIQNKRKKFEISMPIFVGQPDPKFRSVFASRMSYALSADGNFLAATLPASVGTYNGKGLHRRDQYTGAGAVGIWDMQKDSMLFTLSGKGEMISSVSFSPSGHQISAGTLDGKVLVWDFKSRKLRNLIRNSPTGYDYAINQIQFTNDEEQIITAGGDGILRIWNTSAYQGRVAGKYPVCPPAAHASAPISQDNEDDEREEETSSFSFKLSPNQKRLITLNEGRAQLWGLDRPIQPVLLDNSAEPVKTKDFTFSSDGLLIATAGLHVIRIWNPDRGVLLNQLQSPADDIQHIRIDKRDDKYQVVTSDFNRLSVYTLSSDYFVKSIWGDPGLILKADGWPSAVKAGGISIDIVNGIISPDGNLIIAVSNNGVLQAFDQQAKLKYTLREFAIDGRNSPLAFAKSGRCFLAKNMDDTLLVFASSNGKRMYSYKPDAAVSAAALSPDGVLLAVAFEGASSQTNVDQSTTIYHPTVGGPSAQSRNSNTYPIKIIDLKTHKILRELTGHSDRIRDLDFSADGGYLASCSEDATVRIWPLKTKGKTIVCKGQHGIIWHVSISRSGDQVVSAAQDSTAVIWDALTGQKRTAIRHQGSVSRALLSDDGLSLLTCWQGNVSVWNVNSGKERNRFIVHNEKFVYNAGFAGTGQIFSVGEDGRAEVYPIAINSWLQEGMRLAPHPK